MDSSTPRMGKNKDTTHSGTPFLGLRTSSLRSQTDDEEKFYPPILDDLVCLGLG